jgi:hypothetical protein
MIDRGSSLARRKAYPIADEEQSSSLYRILASMQPFQLARTKFTHAQIATLANQHQKTTFVNRCHHFVAR